MFNTSEISEPFQNISYIRTISNNNDAYSLLSHKPNDSKKIGSGISLFSILDKKEDSLNLSKRATDRQIKALRDHQNSINPTFNIIVNNNNVQRQNKSNKLLNKRVSFKSLKDQKNNFFNLRKKSILNNNNNLLANNNNKQKDFKKRSYSFSESGLFLKQFYNLMSNSKFFKNKYQILKEIQNKVSSMKRNNSLKDLQAEFKLKNSSPFYKYNLQNGKENEEDKTNIEKSNESKTSEHNIHIIKFSSSMLNEDNENSINNNADKGGEILHEFFGDKSSFNFIQDKDNNVFKKLNKKKY